MALLVVGLVVAVTIRANVFVPWGTDSASYLIAADGWASRQLFTPSSFVFWAQWDRGGDIEAPLGMRPGPTQGSLTSVYPLGYPLLLAAASTLGGPLAAHCVAPLFAGLLVWCAFLLGSRLNGPWAGAAAAFLVAATPVGRAHAVLPMSDVPATALWILGWVLALQPGMAAATASGLSAALAMMVRPNLAPLVVAILVSLVFAQGPRRIRLTRLVAFLVCASVGPAIVMWSQAALYGNAFSPGYGGYETFFSTERIVRNLRHYPGLLSELHTWLPFLGLLLVPLLIWRARRGDDDRQRALVAISGVAIIVINSALYLTFFTYEGWYWLRFMLPAMTALFVLFAALLGWIGQIVSSRSRWLAAPLVIPLLLVAWQPFKHLVPLSLAEGQHTRLMQMGHYLREAMPGNAVILTYAHGGAAALYTGRPIVRLDLIVPDSLDSIIADLRRHALRPVFMLDHAFDGQLVLERFGKSQFGRFDWPPRAEFFSGNLVTTYHDPVDREAFFSGDRDPIDMLEWPTDAPHQGSWLARAHVPLESVQLPLFQESIRFRDALETKYRDGLHRTSVPSRVNDREAAKWLRRYVRFRVHGCDHQQSLAKVFAQIDGHGAQPLCHRVSSVRLPPRNETVDFRRQLDAKLSGTAAGVAPATAVDLEGEAVWMQEYLGYRFGNCSHDYATASVLDVIDGKPPRPVCPPER